VSLAPTHSAWLGGDRTFVKCVHLPEAMPLRRERERDKEYNRLEKLEYAKHIEHAQENNICNATTSRNIRIIIDR
jgi:hypothetical protein